MEDGASLRLSFSGLSLAVFIDLSLFKIMFEDRARFIKDNLGVGLDPNIFFTF